MVDGTSGGALTLNRVRISGGNVMGPGGGIFNVSGSADVERLGRDRNTSAQAGGGIASGFGATATLNNSEVSWNTVPTDGSGGGGIVSLGSALTLNSSTVDHNTGPGGGGIASGNGMGGGPGSSITLNKSVISNNTALGNPMSGGGGYRERRHADRQQQSDHGEHRGRRGWRRLAQPHDRDPEQDGCVRQQRHQRQLGNPGLGGGIVNAIFFAGQPTPTLLVNNSQVTGNSASGDGGGIVNISFDPTVPAGTVTLNHTDVNSNTPDNCVPPGAVPGCTG